jgi:hypothetical protein
MRSTGFVASLFINVIKDEARISSFLEKDEARISSFLGKKVVVLCTLRKIKMSLWKRSIYNPLVVRDFRDR